MQSTASFYFFLFFQEKQQQQQQRVARAIVDLAKKGADAERRRFLAAATPGHKAAACFLRFVSFSFTVSALVHLKKERTTETNATAPKMVTATTARLEQLFFIDNSTALYKKTKAPSSLSINGIPLCFFRFFFVFFLQV